MNNSRSESIPISSIVSSTIGDYLMLIKLRLTLLVVFTAVASYIVASNLHFSGLNILLLSIGGFGVAGASNALNQGLEKDYDILMKRTKDRPVASGRMTLSHAVMFAGLLCLVGITVLALFNVLTAFLGMLAFITYSFVYTPLKRYSSAAVFVGAIAGAMPMIIGVVAFTGSITWLALSLFIIQFAWQYPHFWAIGFLGYEDYKKAGFNFIPEKSGSVNRSISTSSIYYTLVLIAVTIGMFVYGIIGIVAFIGLFILALVYMKYAIDFYRNFNVASAKKLMFSSLIYIPLVLIILIIDKF